MTSKVIGLLLTWFFLFGGVLGWVLGFHSAHVLKSDPLADEYEDGGGI
jgi:hypothetical protein